MSNYDEFDLDIIQTSPTGDGIGPDVVSALVACSKPCITESTCFSCSCTQCGDCTVQTCGTGCQVTTSINMK